MSRTPRTLNVTECHQLLNTLLPEDTTQKKFRQGIRNYTIALLMVEAGLRVGEVVQLLISDLWFNSAPVLSIIVRPEIAKTKSERIIPVSTRLSDAIKQMHQSYWTPTTAIAEGFAFYRKNPASHVTTRQVERFIRAAAMRSIGRPVHPHMLRHTFGTRIERKAGIRVTQELLGHEHVTSTQIYTHPNEDDKRKAIDEVQAELTGQEKDLESSAGLSDAPDR